ncbi:MAG: response regulator [Elusimicrobia bacterium]|nr:response regulator [Elusimicrobiota bacterium]
MLTDVIMPGNAEAVSASAFLVDDEPRIRSLCARVLSGIDCRVLAAEDGEPAARMLDGTHDVVVSDISMPGAVDGNELVRLVRS